MTHAHLTSGFGVSFRCAEPNTCTMTIPEKFWLELLQLATKFSKSEKKTASLAEAHTLCGRAGRLAQVVPEAKPFVSALFAALAGSIASGRSGSREAPPSKVATSRYRTAAAWLVALLQGEYFRLQHTFYLDRQLLSIRVCSVEFDASPWGGGALLVENGEVVEHFSVCWDLKDAEHLGVEPTIPDWQSFWELATLILAIVRWSALRDGITYMGDNISSLELALSGKAKGPMAALARELLWRKARNQWYYGVAHLAAEANTTADSLSRFSQPGVVASLPLRCKSSVEVPPMRLIDLWQI